MGGLSITMGMLLIVFVLFQLESAAGKPSKEREETLEELEARLATEGCGQKECGDVCGKEGEKYCNIDRACKAKIPNCSGPGCDECLTCGGRMTARLWTDVLGSNGQRYWDECELYCTA